MSSRRPAFRTLILILAAIAGGNAAPARAGGCFVILPSTLELCTNGASFLVREFDACGAGATMHAGFWNQATTSVLHSSAHTFGAQGDVYRYELSYPTAGYVAGDMVSLTVTDNPAESSGSLGTTIEVPIADCSLLANGEFLEPYTTGWSADGTIGQLTDTTFDYDGDATDTDALGFGSFVLLSTARTIPFDSNVDVDLSGADEFEVARLSQTFKPGFPCRVSFSVGFFTDETAEDPEGQDDLFWYEIDGRTTGYNLPFRASDSQFINWPDAFDLIPRAPTGVGGDLALSSFQSGGVLTSFYDGIPVGGDGADVTVAFRVADEGDSSADSGLLIDEAACFTTLLFAAGFEVGLLEWDAAVGAP